MKLAQNIITFTEDKQCATVLKNTNVGDGIHIEIVGGDCQGKTELPCDILLRSGIFVESPENFDQLDVLTGPSEPRNLFGMLS